MPLGIWRTSMRKTSDTIVSYKSHPHYDIFSVQSKNNSLMRSLTDSTYVSFPKISGTLIEILMA